jgi:7,8-dihydropterin-6-yl-methyl-4-(beta-D-ribofuranosyl)aminobenzene 5'-phosphate synthase
MSVELASRLVGTRLMLMAAVLALAGLLAAAGQAGSARAATVRTEHATAVTSTGSAKPTIVLVHGAWADSGSWNAVIGLLRRAGYTVYAPPNPLEGLAIDTATLADFLRTITGPVVLVGHSYGSALVTVRRGDTTTSVLFDTGLSPDAMVTNASRLGLDLSGVHAVVLSHGHFDHAGGLAGLAGRRGTRSLPMVVHPLVWTRRRLALPGGGADDWPTLSKHALTGEGFDVIERRQPSLLVDGSILITGEVDRTTDFEHGMPPAHQHWTGTTWEPDPLILDDQALVANVRGKGLVIVTGCGHAGAVNIVRHAQRLTGVPRLHALLGGLHLGGAFFTPSIGPTVHALTELAPDLLAPGHCTGWRAQHTLAAALPDSWVQGSSGTRYQLTASLPQLTWHLLAAEVV